MTENPARHLDTAGDAVRAFNHASGATGPDWEYPSHAYSALGNLSYLVGMLEQAVEQSTRPVMRTYEQDRVLIDGGGDPAEKVVEMSAARFAAMDAAAALTAAVQRMHNATAPMGLDTTGMPEFEDDV